MGNTYQNRFCLIACLSLILLSPLESDVIASDNDVTRLSLGGLDRVIVLVETVSSEMKQEGLTQDAFFSDVSMILKTAGIELMSGEESPGLPGNPYLYVNVNAFKSDEYVYAISLEFRRSVFLSRNP